MNASFRSIIDKIRKFRDERDWMQFHEPRNLATALSVEASELLEHFTWKNKEEVEAYLANTYNKEEVADEVADILIYLLEFADVLEIDLDHTVSRKMAKNALKYPIALSRGNAKKYTSLSATSTPAAHTDSVPKTRKGKTAKLSELMKE